MTEASQIESFEYHRRGGSTTTWTWEIPALLVHAPSHEISLLASIGTVVDSRSAMRAAAGLPIGPSGAFALIRQPPVGRIKHCAGQAWQVSSLEISSMYRNYWTPTFGQSAGCW
jgi:hypothetical protein